LAGLLIAQVQEALGAERPSRDEQPNVLGGQRVGMDDPKVDTRDPVGIQAMPLYGHGGSDSQPQSPTVSQQGDRAELLGRIWQRAGQPHPELRVAFGDRQPHPLTLDPEGTAVIADRHQGALAPREPNFLLLAAALGRLEPCVAVAAQH
jgi:hypothetical protein